MRRKTILILILVAFHARAETSIFLGSGVRFDSEASGTSSKRNYPLRIGMGHWFSNFVLGMDFSRYVTNSSAGVVDINDEHLELLFWVRGSFWKSPTWKPYGSLILGFQQDTINTSFQNDHSTDRGKLEWVLGTGIGVFNRFWGDLAGGLEARGLYRPWASPKYSGEFVVSLGWIF